MKGYVTATGTLSFKQNLIEKKEAHPEHFREFLGLNFSSLGMGTYLGGIDKKTDELVTKAVLDSITGGINVIDTAINYRYQLAERSVGLALDSLSELGFTRDQIFISTKNGYIPGDADLRLDPNSYIREVVLKNNLAKKDEIINYNCTTIPFLEQQLEQSLKNLGLETIDLLYLHNVAESQKLALGSRRFYEMIAECFEFCEQKIAAGKIRYYGLATWDCFRVEESSPEHVDLEELVTLSSKARDNVGNDAIGFKFVMLPFNLAMQEANTLANQNGKTFLQKATELEVGVFASVPIYQGQILSSPALQQLVVKLGVKTPAQAALQFVRSFGMPLVAPLIGHKQPEHVSENLELVHISPV